MTETIVTEIVEVTEYPSGDKGGDPIVTRTVRVLNGVAEELAEVDKTTNSTNLICLPFHSFLFSSELDIITSCLYVIVNGLYVVMFVMSPNNMWTFVILQLQSDGHSSSDQDSSLDRWRVCFYPSG